MPSDNNYLKSRFIFVMGVVICFYLASIAEAEVLLSKEEALKEILGEECDATYDPRELTSKTITELEEAGAWVWDRESKVAHFFVCAAEGSPSRFALIDEEIGKHLPITYIVGLSSEGKVTRVEIMVYREEYGWEVRDKKFVSQFEGRGVEEDLKVGAGIRNIAGATYSAKSLTRGVRRAIILWEKFYGPLNSSEPERSEKRTSTTPTVANNLEQ